jgi:membrane protein DedA with SNARE-associated domain
VTRVRSFVLMLFATLTIWFALMTAAIATVQSLSEQGAINLLGGILVFAVLLSLALLVDGYLWVRWIRQHRRRA